jgi:hypothetical protein
VNTGVISTTAVALNAGTKASYSLVITAVDRAGGAGFKSSTCVVLVTVTSVNSNNPAFTQATYSGNVNENEAVGFQILKVMP